MNLRILIAPDSFKESLTAAEAAQCMKDGVLAADPDAEVVMVPLSDGGEGFLEAIAGPGAETIVSHVRSACGDLIEAQWTRHGSRAWVEVARIVGLEAIPLDHRDPMTADTRGVGAVLREVIEAGCTEVIIGLGGTATSDGGAGMLAELGARFLDASGTVLEPTPAGLRSLHQADVSGLDPRLGGLHIVAASDVTAPLTGPTGAAPTFAPQKGASLDEVTELDGLLSRLSFLVEGQGERHCSQLPGAGAAGGLGWALMYLGAEMRSGFDLVAEARHVAEELTCTDLVLTGEGSFDGQSLQGKVVSGLARRAAEAGVPCHVLAGRVGEVDEQTLAEAGVTSVTAITPVGTDLSTALRQAGANLTRATTRVVQHAAREPRAPAVQGG